MEYKNQRKSDQTSTSSVLTLLIAMQDEEMNLEREKFEWQKKKAQVKLENQRKFKQMVLQINERVQSYSESVVKSAKQKFVQNKEDNRVVDPPSESIEEPTPPEELPGTDAPLDTEDICSQEGEQNIPPKKKKYIQFICDICGQDFKHKQSFHAHRNRHLGLMPYKCKLCQQRFNAVLNLKRHMRKHYGILPFTCRVCKRKFLDSYDRTRCERMCSNDRPFKCNLCDKAFTAHYILKNHVRTHTGDRPFSCTICDRKFTLKKHLESHNKSTIHQKKETELKLKEITAIDK